MTSNSDLDDLDQQIMNQLRQDGRMANAEIARRLGVSETTIRKRIRRLSDSGILQVAAFTDLPRLGYDVDVLIGINCVPGQVESVAEAVDRLTGVRYMAFVAGRFDLIVAAYLRTQADLYTFLTTELGNVPGIQRTETLLVVRVLRREYSYWHLGAHR